MEIIQFIQSFASPFFDGFFQLATMLGEETFYVVVLALVYWCVDKRFGYRLSFAFLFSSMVNGVIKGLVNAPRPIGVKGIRSLRVETATGSSFPSGHTQSIASFMVSVMRQLRKWWIYAAGSVLVLLVGVSRLYLGVHWPVDVLGGIVFGIVSVLLADLALAYVERKNLRWLPMLLLIPTLAAVLVWSDYGDLVKTAGTFGGFLVGYWAESTFIRFETKAPVWKRVVKFAVGMAIVMAIKEGLKLVLPHAPIYDFLRYFVMGLWITVGAPLLFSALRLQGSLQKAEKEPAAISR